PTVSGNSVTKPMPTRSSRQVGGRPLPLLATHLARTNTSRSFELELDIDADPRPRSERSACLETSVSRLPCGPETRARRLRSSPRRERHTELDLRSGTGLRTDRRPASHVRHPPAYRSM